MDVVIDTNVFVAAAMSPEGARREVLRRCLQGRFSPLMGQALFTEYEDVLGRDVPWTDAPITAAERQILWAAFVSVCRWTRVYYLWRPNLRDEADNHLIELAIAGGAAAIATHNVRDLRAAELQFPSVRILTPRELLLET